MSHLRLYLHKDPHSRPDIASFQTLMGEWAEGIAEKERQEEEEEEVQEDDEEEEEQELDDLDLFFGGNM